jgi:flagellar M-ring protein FliF
MTLRHPGPQAREGWGVLEFLRQLVNGVAQAWRRLSISARVQLALAALITLGLVAGASYFGAQPQYGRLHQHLALDESNEIAVWLTEQNIPYRLRDGGTSIDVPVRDISRARVGLSAQNLPGSQGSVPGFELFDKRDLMTNRYLQDVDYVRALRGELQRQLNQFDFVKNSYVFIREAPDELFSGEQKPSQATVTLQTSGGPVSPTQVKAVLHTVSSFGGANLSEKNIAIMSTDGTVLHGISEDEFASLATDKLGVQVAYEQQAEKKIRDAFRELHVNAVVKVSAILDWTSEEVKDRKLSEGQPVSTLVTKDETREAQPAAEGPPGAVANIPEELGRPNEKNLITTSTENIENSEPSETLRTTKTQPGRLKQYKVAAYIDPGYDPVVQNGQPVLDANGKAQMQPKQFSPQQITEYSDFIRNAVGGGDTVETDVVVYAQPFSLDQITAAPPETLPGVPWRESDWFQWTWRIGLVAFMFLLIRFLMRRALVVPTTQEEGEVLEIPEATPAERRAQEISSEVERLSQQEPDTVAALLRTWMSEE